MSGYKGRRLFCFMYGVERQKCYQFHELVHSESLLVGQRGIRGGAADSG